MNTATPALTPCVRAVRRRGPRTRGRTSPRMNAKSATSAAAPWRMIQSRKSSSFTARNPRGWVRSPSASTPRTLAVITETRCHVRRTSASASTASRSAMRTRRARGRVQRPRRRTQGQPPRRAVARWPRESRPARRQVRRRASAFTFAAGVGELVNASRDASGNDPPVSDSRKSATSRRARRTKSTIVGAASDPSGSPGSWSLVVNRPIQWCQPPPARSSRPTSRVGIIASRHDCRRAPGSVRGRSSSS